jgi:triacylglycerol esterase/lipase EstA (alpha/beta hydrolase family)
MNIKFTFLLVILLSMMTIDSKSADSPYPVIFVHGLNSDDQTWNTTITQLSQAWNLSGSHTLNAVLNARGGDTTSFVPDVLFPLRDANGNIVNSLSVSSIYAVNFGNFWNRNPSDPRIILYNNSLPGSNQSPSNQSAITKQAYALSVAIDSVLRITGASKVILLGHSMGGLAIREYLQRKENGLPKWWVEPGDTVNGHRVAKVVTTGTPHLGTNTTSIPLLTIDNNSEAMRDMRFTYSNGQTAAYLFTNNESSVPTSYYNNDIDCNNISGDQITGTSSGNTFNSLLPLPSNITYTWITSNYLGLGTDLAVPTSRQWLSSGSVPSPAGLADTLFNTRSHLQQTSDTRSIIRGLDEPDRKDFAYDVFFDKTYSAFITAQSNGLTSDTDFYKVSQLSGGTLSVLINSTNAGVTSFSILSSTGVNLVSKSYASPADSISYLGNHGSYFVRVIGNSNQNTNLNFHNFRLRFVPAIRLDLTLGIEGMWNGTTQIEDTVRVFLRSSSSPFNVVDSAVSRLNADGNDILEFLNASAGSYYVQVKHRNGLETWSSAPVSFSNGITSLLDFTTAQSIAYGNNLVLKSGKWCIYSGDVEGDGAIDATDLALIDNDASGFATGYLSTDLDGNEFVDGTDYALADNNASNFVSVIRP